MTGEQLKKARVAMGWTQYVLADALGITRASLAHWERGRAPVPPQVGVVVRQALKFVDLARERLAGTL